MAGVNTPVVAGTPAAAPRVATGEVRLRRDTWRGWPGAIFLNNGLVEVVIVPSIGRIMQFRFVGEAEGSFWENPNTEGWQTRPDGREWINFGGDKSWPAPQSDWAARTPRAWPPPPAFDQAEHAALIDDGTVTLVSPVDPHFGMRSHRTIRLDPHRSFMTVNTSYEKVIGEPVRVSVWVITQLKEPLGVYVPVPASSRFSRGYTLLSEAPPPGMELKDGLLAVKRNPAASHKIGSDAGTLVWVGERSVLRMDSPRVRGASYPDNGSSAEVYTSADPLPYVELEMLGPLESLKVGERLDQACVYTLLERTEDSPEAEARKVLAR
ncbi:MAG TPA: DUF4380 domain-containing protein [Methylomirabilota bacterium]|nr:DUF4380 domain-containing protein [Methylomirabilota bacterium]